MLTILTCSLGALMVMAVLNLRVGIVSERTLSYMTPVFALVFGVGAASLPARPRTLLVGAWVVWAILTPQHIIPRLNSDLAAQAVAAGYSPRDLVIVETGFDDMAFAYELETALPPDDRRVFPTFYEYNYPDDPAMLAALDAQIADSDRVWLIYWNVPPRLHDRLRAAGFSRTGRDSVPVGIDDPLYVLYPQIEVSRYVRPRIDAAAALDFGGELRLLDVVAPERVAVGGAFSADLVWQPIEAPDRDYTVALFLQDAEGVTRLESFGPDTANPTTAWRLDAPTIDTHRLNLPAGLPAGRYSLYAVVYWYQTVDQPLSVNGAGGATIATFDIE